MTAADDFTNALMQMGENMLQFVEFAEGQRKVLEERGWSPTAAEQYASELLQGMVRQAFAGGKK